MRLAVFAVLGNKCTCCGEARNSMLQVDHIHNDGRLEKRSSRSYYTLLAVLRAANPHERFQILCANCNISKAILGQCEHVQGRISLQNLGSD